MKKCMISTIETLFPKKTELKTAIEKVPLGRNTFTRRIEEIGEALTKSTLQDVMNCESKIPWNKNKIMGVATDGAPAMVAKHSGFAKYLKDRCPNLLACHCIIHDTVL